MRSDRNMRIYWVAMLFLLIASCATSGQFNYSKVPNLELHAINNTEYRDLFGEPLNSVIEINTFGKYERVNYSYVKQFYWTTFPKILERRGLQLEFKNGQLNGYLYWSSVDEDKTRVELSNIDKIKIGTSTKDDLLTLMGKPHGKMLCPTTFENIKVKCDKATEIWFWNEIEKDYVRQIRVSFDKDGRVIDLDATGSK
jgi:hypothetical protein